MVNSLSKYRVKKIITCFCEDIDTTKTSNLLGINHNTINKYFNQFCLGTSTNLSSADNKILAEFELDESYFSAKRVCGKRGQVPQENPSIWIVKRDGKVYVEIVKTVPVPY